MVIKCQFADCGEKCEMNSACYESIFKHQMKCRACDKCKYFCPITKETHGEECGCKQYFFNNELEDHINSLSSRNKEKIQEINNDS